MFDGNYYLIYASKCSEDLTEADIMRMLQLCKRNNDKRDIRSVLVHKPGQFLHFIEADDKAKVQYLYKTIKLDSRHHQVEVIHESANSPPIARHAVSFRSENSNYASVYRAFFRSRFDFKTLKSHPRMLSAFFKDLEQKNEETMAKAVTSPDISVTLDAIN